MSSDLGFSSSGPYFNSLGEHGHTLDRCVCISSSIKGKNKSPFPHWEEEPFPTLSHQEHLPGPTLGPGCALPLGDVPTPLLQMLGIFFWLRKVTVPISSLLHSPLRALCSWSPSDHHQK